MEQPPPPALCYSFESLKLKVPERGFVDSWVSRRPLLSNAFCIISYSVPYSPFWTSGPFLPSQLFTICWFICSILDYMSSIFLKANPGLCKKQIYWGRKNIYEGFKHVSIWGSYWRVTCQQNYGRGRWDWSNMDSKPGDCDEKTQNARNTAFQRATSTDQNKRINGWQGTTTTKKTKLNGTQI